MWAFPAADQADEAGVVAVGGDLEPGTLLTAYRCGLFPMPFGRRGEVGWWSPDPRGILPLQGLQVSRSLRRSYRRFEIRVDFAFEQVIDACADPSRPDGWITGEMRAAYVRLHELGWAHSVECWDPADDTLAGGLYGLAVGGLFAGESMFHRRTDASKVALMGLVELLSQGGALGRLLDVQWVTPHLAGLGAEEVPRRRYLEMVRRAVKLPLPRAFQPPFPP
ncbi:MAG TPA: leucyl/phenylalanyl-tRNA--protein transferase [Acidimicrobiales bacterium]|nr:leucyl/phenylalanyl-tRNA--protein transferase [Acidimicrobiales bacterium]